MFSPKNHLHHRLYPHEESVYGSQTQQFLCTCVKAFWFGIKIPFYITCKEYNKKNLFSIFLMYNIQVAAEVCTKNID